MCTESLKSSERPKPEFSAGTGTRTEIIPVRFRFGNSYRNRNRHFTPYSPHSQIKKVGISIILHKNLLYRVISLYCGENIFIVYWNFVANTENLQNMHNIVSVLSFGSGSVPVR